MCPGMTRRYSATPYDIVARLGLTNRARHWTRRIVFASDQCFSRP